MLGHDWSKAAGIIEVHPDGVVRLLTVVAGSPGE